MLKLADVKIHDIVYDLGCSDGWTVISATKEYGACGVEAEENAQKSWRRESLVHFEGNDLFKANIHEASVVTLFSCAG